jgi:hypothetical protein
MNENKLRPDQRYRVVGWNRLKAHPTDRELALLTQAEGSAPPWPKETMLDLTAQILTKVTECCEGMEHARATLTDLGAANAMLATAISRLDADTTMNDGMRALIRADINAAMEILQRVRGPSAGPPADAS